MKASARRFRRGLLLSIYFLLSGVGSLFPMFSLAAEPIADCSESNLRQALVNGGTVSFNCDGRIILSETLTISVDTVLDASGRQVTLSGNAQVRVLHVLPGVHVTLINLKIADGRSSIGAGLYNDDGVVTLINCVVATNQAIGLSGVNGTNAPLDQSLSPGGNAIPGGEAKGGGIFNAGLLRVTNTVFLGNTALGGVGGAGGRGGDGQVFVMPPRLCRSIGVGAGGLGGDGGDAFGGAIYNLGEASLHNVTAADNRATGGAGEWIKRRLDTKIVPRLNRPLERPR